MGKSFLSGTVALLTFALTANVQAAEFTVAYQTAAEPAKLAQAENDVAGTSGATVNWRKFDSGSAVLRALASGDVQIGNIGSSPLAVAASQKLPVEAFLIASQLGQSEALVVKKEIRSPQDLIGKRIAVPFISTTHYSLLSALKHWGIKPDQLTIINLQPPAIAAAWRRGDIDGAYVWAPVVNDMEKQGRVLTDSEQVGKWGNPTLDIWVVRKDFASMHPEIVTAFTASMLKAQKGYLDAPDAWLRDKQHLSTLSRLSGVPQDQVAALVKGNRYLPVSEQITQLGKPVEKAIHDTAEFLKSQGKIAQADGDYSAWVNSRFVRQVQAAPKS